MFTPAWDLKEVQIGSFAHQVLKIGTSLSEEEKHDLFDQLIKYVNLFAWAPSDMPWIDNRVVSHCLNIHPYAKLVAQRKQIVF